MPNMLRTICLGSFVVVGVPALAQSQTGRPEQSGMGRTSASGASAPLAIRDTLGSYDERALRVETRMGEYRIVRGLNGPVVGKIGTFTRVDLAPLVAPSENAMREAREFNRNHGPGMLAGLTGLIVFGVAAAASSVSNPNWGLATAEIGGAALMLYGAARLDKAYGALSRAIWWYNRDLNR